MRGADLARALVVGLGEKMPKIVWWATSDAGWKAKTKVQAAIPTMFDRPTPMVKSSPRLISEREFGNVILAMKDVYDSSTDARMSRILEPHIFAVPREWRPSEKWFARAGLLHPGEYLVPSRSAPLDAYGNIPGSVWQKIIADMNLYTSGGQNTLRGRKYIWGVTPTVRGVFKVAGGVAGGGAWQLILAVVRGANYRERFTFYDMAMEEFDRAYPVEFDRIFRREVAAL